MHREREGLLVIYLVGSLRNSHIPEIGRTLRSWGYEVFDDWHAAGPEADDCWKAYEQQRGRTYQKALRGLAAQHVFEYDRYHLQRADMGVLLLPCGKSGWLEAGWLLGRGKPVYAVLPPTEDEVRWDVMLCFMTGVVSSVEELKEKLPHV